MTQAFGGYQNEIYLQGMGGTRPAFSTDATRLEEAARGKLEPEPFWYVAGGAGSGATMRANREAFDRWRLVPRMLREVSERDLSTTLFGTRLASPVLLAPVGVQGIVHPDGELATARAAAALDVPMILSTASSTGMAEVAEANGDGHRWYQLYWPHDDEVTLSLLDRAKRAGFTALVVTLDTWTLAWRPHDLDNAYLPFLKGTGLAIPFGDPAFLAGLAKPPAEDLPAAILRWLPMFNGRSHTWEQLSLLRENWDGPIVLKGIQDVADARRAVDAGMDGIVVSNHGGRQVDGAIAALDALPAVAGAVGDQLTVLFDSGIRTGADVIKAIALGAKAVLLARPYVYGLALDGEAGVRHVLRSLLADLDLTLGLAGHRSVAELGADCLQRI
ncbi:lactate 2-monooxygenase [Kutzneria viridogrisea]|uniref:Isopentenyl diphosphate isomerase/L-lactate dehydrogenase-like FMN-dependent dehydrogenase n=2 Tax=Kutzneria TaxID=43356 RepID=A0ABR6BUU6_9PSEU|nr:lactate 2-monooxygenase [Kutzneria albida]AHH94781.1 putative lactate 2-monooxygenase PB1A11.03 [Kutzneria albida DSM 43870]MBA8930450.1 isopentenyl diphosphate isomerase/L-lactate dehydrogenase-like FMN-dependent dehydrogenase [Kutzneria viridogrisea]